MNGDREGVRGSRRRGLPGVHCWQAGACASGCVEFLACSCSGVLVADGSRCLPAQVASEHAPHGHAGFGRESVPSPATLGEATRGLA